MVFLTTMDLWAHIWILGWKKGGLSDGTSGFCIWRTTHGRGMCYMSLELSWWDKNFDIFKVSKYWSEVYQNSKKHTYFRYFKFFKKKFYCDRFISILENFWCKNFYDPVIGSRDMVYWVGNLNHALYHNNFYIKKL